MELKLSVAVMAHPDRRESAEELAALLESQRTEEISPVQVVFDENRAGPWTNARSAWVLGVEAAAGHHLVIQDDVLPCSDFLPAAVHILRLVSQPVAFFSRTRGVDEAREAGTHWAVERSPWGQALCLPTSLIPLFLDWVEGVECGLVKPRLKRVTPKRWKQHDDERLMDFLAEYRLEMLATAPSLVEHLVDEMPSVMRHPAKMFGYKRTARWYIGRDARAMDLDWRAGLANPLG